MAVMVVVVIVVVYWYDGGSCGCGDGTDCCGSDGGASIGDIDIILI